MKHDIQRSRCQRFLRLAVLCGAMTGVISGPAHAAGLSFFDMSEKRSDNVSPFPKWTGMVVRYDEQEAYSEDGECGKLRFFPCSVLQWQDMVENLQGQPLMDQLNQVNDWSNEHLYIEDQINWGLDDYWETPHEFMEISGDCEDYAISKYYTMRALGVSADRLRIIILQDLNLGGVIHAVLGVYGKNDELFILDNQSKRVTPALKIYHYRPIFGINENSWWAYYPRE